MNNFENTSFFKEVHMFYDKYTYIQVIIIMPNFQFPKTKFQFQMESNRYVA